MNEANFDAPRLIINKIVMENFKSYYGVKEIGPFHESFTCIVGPNGSGKSNVIDAVQFVFGKRGNKIRLKKLSELIHNSETQKDVKKARVTVYFSEIVGSDENYQVVEKSDFSITRTVNSKSTSKYYINDALSNFNEVQDKLKGKGVDLEFNRFLILQGEVEQISLMKPKSPSEHEDGLLEYIEDIIGTTKYKDPIEKAGVKVEELNEKRNECLNRVKISENEKDGLESSKNEAEEYLKKKKKLMEKRIMLNKVNESNLNKNHEQTNKKKEKNQEEIDKILEEKKKIESEKDDLKKSYEKAKSDYDKSVKELNKTKEEFDKFDRQNIKLKQDLKNLNEKYEKLSKKNESNKKKLEKSKTTIERITKEENEKTKKKDEVLEPDLKNCQFTIETLIESAENEIKPVRIELEKYQKEYEPFKKKFQEINQKIKLAESEIELLTKSKSDLEKKIKDCEELSKRNESEYEKTTTELKTKEKFLTQVSNRIPKIKEELMKVNKEEKEKEDSFENKVKYFNQIKNDMESKKSNNKVLEYILSLKLDGVVDRLGNLGTIDKKYDIAISTACSSLDCIVVEDTKTAKQCVEKLREENIGVATFLIMEKISENKNLMEESNKKIDTPGNNHT
jgi:structural maintenance of chromosome 4